MDAGPAGTTITSHHQYVTDGMSASELDPAPMVMFNRWFQDALRAGVTEPEAMTLTTTSLPKAPAPASGSSGVNKSSWRIDAPRPSARTVLLKRADEQGFQFFTNYGSRKGEELAANPWCALTFYWPTMHRSVRVLGRAERLPRDVSKAYFDSRPVGSRIGAWASPQSQAIASRDALQELVHKAEKRFGVTSDASDETNVPLPDHWGGFLVIPDEIEFWTGRANRLHDRFRCVLPLTLTQLCPQPAFNGTCVGRIVLDD